MYVLASLLSYFIDIYQISATSSTVLPVMISIVLIIVLIGEMKLMEQIDSGILLTHPSYCQFPTNP